MSKRMLTGASVVAGALLLAACGGGGGSSSTGASGSSGVLRIGSDSTIDSLNPFVGFNQLSYALYQNTYPYLVQYSADLTFDPYLATAWKTSADGKTWTFSLVKGAKWSDGQPLTSADAAWTINTILKCQSGGATNLSGSVAHIVKATTPDDTTLVIQYAVPVANVLSQLQQLPILPQHFWKDYTGGKDCADLTTVNLSAKLPLVSGGPFQLVNYKKNQFAGLKANPNFFGTKPHVEGVGIQEFPDNDDGMIAALKNGDLDLIESLPPTGVKPLQDAGFNVVDSPSTTWYDVIFNSNPAKTNHRELLDPKVKEALAYAINIPEMIDVVWLGTAKPGSVIVPPTTNTPEATWANPNLTTLPYSPDKANQILDSLGYKKGSDGIRQVPGGGEMSYEIIQPSLSTGDRQFQLIQGYWKAVGVKVTEKKMDASAAFDAITAPNGQYKNFDIALWDWVPLIDPDFILSVLTKAQWNGWSDTGFDNPTYDKLYKLQGTQTDLKQRQATVWQMQKIAYDQRPYIVLAYTDWLSASSTKWTGFEEGVQGPLNALNIYSLVNAQKA